MQKAIFLDRDGTLNVDEGYTFQVEKYELLPGVIEGLKRLQDAGFLLLILTSQSGIGRGKYTEADYARYRDHMLADFAKNGISIAGVFYCPHHPDKTCECRKPKPGLVNQAEAACGPFDYAKSWSLADGVRDNEMCKNKNAQIRTILFPKNFGSRFEEIIQERNENIDFVVSNFTEAVDVVLANT